MGGTPLRVIRLSERGTGVLDRLLAGSPPQTSADADAAAGSLARRLTDADMAYPTLSGGAAADLRVSVVIPVRDRSSGLAATLLALGGEPVTEVIVVDDASLDRAATRAAVDAARDLAAPVRFLQREHRGGPAAARNTGWRAASGEVIVFVDADCIPQPGWLDRLTTHFLDATLASVAPRIRTPTNLAGQARPVPRERGPLGVRRGRMAILCGKITAPSTRTFPRERLAAPPAIEGVTLASTLERYEAVRSPLDLGPDPAPVRPAGRVSYLPSATLVVRRSALVEVAGFDESMPVGEDVDLVWRLAATGWRVRYDPAATVLHPPRANVAAWMRQRYDYGTSAGPLALRHGGSVAPLRLSWASAASWTLAALVGIGPGLGAGALSIGFAARRLPARTGLSTIDAAGVAVVGQMRAGRAVAETLRRCWWPMAAVAWLAAPPRVRARSAAGVTLPLAVEWIQAGRPISLPAWIMLRFVDDMSYGAGVVVGAWRCRAPQALLPVLLLTGK